MAGAFAMAKVTGADRVKVVAGGMTNGAVAMALARTLCRYPTPIMYADGATAGAATDKAAVAGAAMKAGRMPCPRQGPSARRLVVGPGGVMAAKVAAIAHCRQLQASPKRPSLAPNRAATAAETTRRVNG